MEQTKIVVKGIVRYKDDFLMVKRWYDDCIANPFKWGFIDGKMDFGEGPERCTVRLIKESLGIDAVVDRPLYTWSYMVGDVFYVGICYECLAIQTDIILSEELLEYRWIDKDQLLNNIENKDMLEDISKVDLNSIFS